MTLKSFFLTHTNKENGRGDNHNDILEAEEKPNFMAAVRKAENNICTQVPSKDSFMHI